ncbi:MAG: hypothetical protein HY054_05810 [Proteobacteria bacterium]|nr:hypothetical protein [Pseudomonadota bacterium]
MSGLRNALTVAIAMVCTFVPPSQAQTSTWTEPGGRFSLSFQGWTALPNERAVAAGDMLIIARNDSMQDHRTRICALSQRPPHTLDGGQDAANVYLDRVTASDVQQNVGQPVRNFVHGRTGGVATLDYTVVLNGTQMHTLDFVLAGGGQMVVFDITCGTPPPTTDDEAASISAVLGTLTIIPQTQPAAADNVAGWVLRSPTPGASPCRAVKFGATVDTQLLRARDGRLVLIAGHGDWEHNGGPVEASIAIDDASPVPVTGYGVGPTFLVPISNDQLVALRSAHTVRWHLANSQRTLPDLALRSTR